ncbi:SAM-dependent methyltransferase [Kitasatospora atroaurantiaca]
MELSESQGELLGMAGIGEGFEGWEPPEIDTTVAHSARMYDYWLGGKTHFPPDRALGEAFERAIPSIRTMAQENRRFLGRAVRHLVREAGIRQFLDIGTGIPTGGNTHEIAQAEAPGSRVVYVDNDPIVLAHARALMVSGDQGKTSYIHADLREPEKILDHPSLVGTLDLTQPVGLMLVAILMLLGDEDDPKSKVATLLDALPSGSHVVVTHPSADFNPEAMGAVVTAAKQGHMTLVPRSRDEVAAFFGDWELIEPGVAPVMAWHPEGAPPADPEAAYYWAGIARKP